ncbi:hypothetical protein GIB67_003888 [Kingdonia uniflora]|uniref:Uncharacterized protein n=1 Tax=Kingdonia uniflora TaxID=39325 RepID=A0A7J7LK60_9MAGN|nr:hypothetical protein GIB67_003888 [Kingdonia uniflora]
MQKDDPIAKAWLDMEPYETWCRSYFDFTSKCEHITNNFSESFNYWWIMKIRDKLLDKTIVRLNLILMKLHNERRIKSWAWDQRGLVPRALMHIEKLKTQYGEYDFEEEDDDGIILIGTNGGRWNKYHHVSSYVATYSRVVHVVTDSSNWGKPSRQVEPLPLNFKKEAEVLAVKIEVEVVSVAEAMAVAEAMTLSKKVKHLMFALVEEKIVVEAVAEAMEVAEAMTLSKKVKHLMFVLVEEEVVAEAMQQ